jgi:hypothetical protein
MQSDFSGHELEAAAGLTGIAVSVASYLDELPYFCAEVLPRLAQFHHPLRRCVSP